MTLILFHICLGHNRLLCRLIEAVFTGHAIDLPCFTFDLTDHLRATALNYVLIHKLLTASCVRSGTAASIKIWRLLVITHRGQALVSNTAQMAAPLMVETHVIFFGRLHQL